MSSESENIVKKVCKELNITQKQLAQELSVSEGTVNRWSSKSEMIPEQAKKILQMLIENKRLKEKELLIQNIFSSIEKLKKPTDC